MVSRKERRFRKRIRKKLEPHYRKVVTFLLIPFMPFIKRIRKTRTFIKVIRLLGTIGSLLIKAANLGITAYEFYNNTLKDILEKRNSADSV